MLDYYGKNTNTPLRTETIDKWTRLSVRLHLVWLSC
jgi:hypothetical protein